MPDIPRLRSAIKTHDGWWASIFSGPLANRFLEPIADIQWITPNIITITSFFIGCFAAYCFYSNHLIVAAILVQLSFVVDCMDGQLARYRQQFSKLGAWLDRISDRVKDFLYFFALALGFYLSHGASFEAFGLEFESWIVWPLAMTASFTIFLIDYYVNQDMKLEAPPLVEKSSAQSLSKNTSFNILKPILELGRIVYRFVPILRFNIGEQALLISIFSTLNMVFELLVCFAFLGILYSIYWPVAKSFGYIKNKC